MKWSRINPISKRQSRRMRELAKIKSPENGRCQECDNLPDWRGLQKHHQVKRSQGGDDENNIVWLCGKCHSKYHGIIEK